MEADRTIALLGMAFAAALAAAGGLGWACYRLLVDRGRLLLRLEALAPLAKLKPSAGFAQGSYFSDFALPTLDGRIVTLSGLTGRSLLLVVLQPECLYSRAFAAELRHHPGAPQAPLPVLIVTGDIHAPEQLAPFRDLPGELLLDPAGQTAMLLRIFVTPAGYRCDEQRHAASPLLAGPAALLAAARGEPLATAGPVPPVATTPVPGDAGAWRARQPLAPGDEVPDIGLPLLAGGEWSPRSERGRQWLLLFSDPDCAPCHRLLAGLATMPLDRLVVVSRGEARARYPLAGAQTLVPLAMQRHREFARAFGMVQTPAAYLIDAAGRIAAGPAIGASAAKALIAAYASSHSASPGAATVVHDRGERGHGKSH